MERVPQVGWHDVATKADLGALEMRLRGELASKVELAELRVEIADQFREQNLRLTTTMVTTMLGGISVPPASRSRPPASADPGRPARVSGASHRHATRSGSVPAVVTLPARPNSEPGGALGRPSL